MRAKYLGLVGALVLLAACQPPDPLTAARRTCGDIDADHVARIEACTAIIDSGELEDAERAEALANRGAAQRASGQTTPALRDFEAALSVDENQTLALDGRATILLASGQLDSAEVLIDRLIAAGNPSSHAHEMKGDIALQRGDYPAAITSYDAAIAADGRNAVAFAHRGRAREGQGEHDAAREDFSAAIRIDGNLAEARAARCWINLRTNQDLAQARNDAEAAVAAEPERVEAQLCRGVLQLRGGEWANARTAFEAALAIEPGNPSALFGRGVARRRSGDNDGREDMNQARDFDSRIGETFDDWDVETF